MQERSMSDESADDFLRDQLEALLAAPALTRVANRHTEGSEKPAEVGASPRDRDTEPSIDQQMLRDALQPELK
jgi:hypothetical protein